MLGYLLQRLILMVFTFVVITIVGFTIVYQAPGDPVDVFYGGGLVGGTEGIDAERLENQEQAREELRRQLGLDRPLPVQYAVWMGQLLQGDLGRSFKDSRPVWDKLLERLPFTATLNAMAIVVTFALAIPLGILSAIREHSFADRATTLILFMLVSVPTFWVGTMAIVFLCGGDFFDIFPAAGVQSISYDPDWPWTRRWADWAHHMALPLIISTYGSFAFSSRILRSSMLDAKRQDWARTARAKGVSERVVILKHVLRNSIIPIVTNIGGLLPALIGGSVIIETIFSLPGIGFLGYQSVLARDYPVVLGLFAISSALTLVGILLSDLALVLVDPRINFEGVEG